MTAFKDGLDRTVTSISMDAMDSARMEQHARSWFMEVTTVSVLQVLWACTVKSQGTNVPVVLVKTAAVAMLFWTALFVNAQQTMQGCSVRWRVCLTQTPVNRTPVRTRRCATACWVTSTAPVLKTTRARPVKIARTTAGQPLAKSLTAVRLLWRVTAQMGV